MRSHLALALSRIPNDAEPVRDPDAQFYVHVAAIKSLLMDLEDHRISQAKHNMRVLSKIVSEFVVNGRVKRKVTIRTSPEWQDIWGHLQDMAALTSHDRAIEELRNIQSEYVGIQRAAGVN